MPQVREPVTQVSDLVFHVAPVVKKLEPPAPRARITAPPVKSMNPPALKAPRPKIEPRRVRIVEAPVLTPEFHVPAPVNHRIARPRPSIHTGVLAASVVPLKSAVRKMQKVQTGGFGDPDGVAPTDEDAHPAMTVNTVGSFSSPMGSGKGNGTGESRGAQGRIAKAGFGDAVTLAKREADSRPGEAIHAGVFSNQAIIPTPKAPVPHATKPSIQPVEILEKPEPAYTTKAREHKIQGSVVLDVIFEANGMVDVLRVVRGLGYGLDQAAISAARRIRFRPERIDGKAVNAPASLRIVFRLAY